MRLIDADALHNSLRNKQKWVVRSFYGEKYNEGYTYDQVHFAIDDAPTADAVEVVRCKDCKHGRPYIHTKEYVACEVDCEPIDRDSDFFCADGKRRSE